MQVTARAREMAAARYLRRMARIHRGNSEFDPKKVPAFDPSGVPIYPEFDKDRRKLR